MRYQQQQSHHHRRCLSVVVVVVVIITVLLFALAGYVCVRVLEIFFLAPIVARSCRLCVVFISIFNISPLFVLFFSSSSSSFVRCFPFLYRTPALQSVEKDDVDDDDDAFRIFLPEFFSLGFPPYFIISFLACCCLQSVSLVGCKGERQRERKKASNVCVACAQPRAKINKQARATKSLETAAKSFFLSLSQSLSHPDGSSSSFLVSYL